MLLRVLLKVTEVTTEHQKLPKISKNSITRSFFARWPKKPRSKQELDVSPRTF